VCIYIYIYIYSSKSEFSWMPYLSRNFVFLCFIHIKPFIDLCHYNLVTGTNKQSYSNLNY